MTRTITSEHKPANTLAERLARSVAYFPNNIGLVLERLIDRGGWTEAELRACGILRDGETLAPPPAPDPAPEPPVALVRHSPLSTTFRKADGSFKDKCVGEVGRAACDHIMELFDAALASPDPRAFFAAQLTLDGFYVDWPGPDSKPTSTEEK